MYGSVVNICYILTTHSQISEFNSQKGGYAVLLRERALHSHSYYDGMLWLCLVTFEKQANLAYILQTWADENTYYGV